MSDTRLAGGARSFSRAISLNKVQTVPVNPTRRLAGWIAGAAMLVAVGIVIAFTTFERLDDAAARRRHSRLVLAQAAELLSDTKDAETAMRGFVITGDDGFLEPYVAVKDQLIPDLDSLRRMTTNPEAVAHLVEIRTLLTARLAHVERVLQLARTAGFDAAASAVRQGEGKRLMDALRAEMHSFVLIQEAGQLDHDAQFQRQLGRLFALLVCISGLAVLSAAGAVVFASREAQRRAQAQEHAETQRRLALQEETGRQVQAANGRLQVSEERLRVTLESIGDAVVATDSAGRVTLLNPLAARLTGWPHAEAMGRPVEEILTLVNQETRLPSRVPVADTLAHGTLQGLVNHTVLIARDGTECPIADSCAPIRDREGQVVGAVLVFRDVTQEYAVQQALRDSNVALELARLEADRANVAKSDFLSNMSHEIRTPMNAIVGMSYLALKSDLTPYQREQIRTIQDSGRHLLGIINDILDISRIEAGKLTVESTPFTLDQVLENVASLIAAKAGAKGLELVFDVAKDVPLMLVGDPLRLGQILINYGNNAVKFTEHGEIAVMIRVQERTAHDVLLRYSVRDTGIGLTPEQIGRLFQSFSQADASTTRRFGGSGLGLVISKNLAELMGGQVGVESVSGVGSTFWFTARFGVSAESTLPPGLAADHRGMRALVVDDNASARSVLTDLMRTLTFTVDQAADGLAAIAAVLRADREGRPYSIVLLDWQMPGIDGIETARQIRALVLPRRPHLLMVTAYGREEVIEGAEEVGIEGVLVKPVNASALFDSISRLLGGIVERSRARADAPSDVLDRLASLKGARVLLVEDNAVNQLVASELLRDAGFVVELAENGLVALERVRAARYDIVLMDMQMPVMDGVTATREIRRDPRLQDLPIVAMTANAMQADRDRCLAAGMNAHVAKPIEPDDLWTAMLAWMRPAITAADHEAPAGPSRPSAPLPALDPDALPTHIMGLDTVLGLRRGLGKRQLYLAMLRGFVTGQREAARATRAALDANDWPTAERHAHTLMGVAANVGAVTVQGLARALETAIRERRPREIVDARLRDLQGPLGALMTQLERGLPPVEAPEAVAVDPALLTSVCDQLELLLAADDAAAGALIDANTALLHSAFPEAFHMIEVNIRAYDTESALTALRAARMVAR